VNSWDRFIATIKLFFHPQTPWYVKALLAAAGIYLISPVDLIPDWVAGLGIVDDAAVVPLLISVAYKLMQADLRNRHPNRDKQEELR